jgi:hypothetical protein
MLSKQSAEKISLSVLVYDGGVHTTTLIDYGTVALREEVNTCGVAVAKLPDIKRIVLAVAVPDCPGCVVVTILERESVRAEAGVTAKAIEHGDVTVTILALHNAHESGSRTIDDGARDIAITFLPLSQLSLLNKRLTLVTSLELRNVVVALLVLTDNGIITRLCECPIFVSDLSNARVTIASAVLHYLGKVIANRVTRLIDVGVVAAVTSLFYDGFIVLSERDARREDERECNHE